MNSSTSSPLSLTNTNTSSFPIPSQDPHTPSSSFSPLTFPNDSLKTAVIMHPVPTPPTPGSASASAPSPSTSPSSSSSKPLPSRITTTPPVSKKNPMDLVYSSCSTPSASSMASISLHHPSDMIQIELNPHPSTLPTSSSSSSSSSSLGLRSSSSLVRRFKKKWGAKFTRSPNYIKTTKYTFFSFLPLNLFGQ
ncbi:hypothetical protein HMI55_000276, partial [Coelomomyces lativittatus]